VTTANILRVFTDANGNFGNFASIVFDEDRSIDNPERQAITRRLGHDETVFINGLSKAEVSIFNPQQEVNFAGHAMVGTAWLLARRSGRPVASMHCLGGDIRAWQDADITWIRAGLDMMPPWHHKQLVDATSVEAITPEQAAGMEHTMVWAWVNQKTGLIHARTFASDWGIPEAQGNGSGSMMLAAILHQDIEIKHGQGSIIFAKLAPNNCADIGGRVREESNVSL
jgi:predicted PhzF superfamily epimerase YddE/YHI9